jgi:arabinofuranosyltransferase
LKTTSFPRHPGFLFRTTALVLFLVAVVAYGWNSDDAYHGYIMAKHLAEGNGLVYNIGYRTTASTHPLLTLLEAFIFLFTDNPDVCGLLIGLVFSGLAAWILLFRFCPSPATAWCMLGLMVSSHCFMSFTTSGLENSILFFLGACFLDIYLRNPLLSKRHLFAIALLMALLATTRADSVLVFAPMAVWAYLARTRIPFWRRVPIGMAGLLPFFAWTAFSVLYYGFPFPNTFYAKLHTGISTADYATSGLWYHVSSWALDPMLLLVPVLFVALSVKARNRTLVPLFIGLAFYELYVVSIGGDFMAGRHLTQQYFLSLCGIAFLANTPKDGGVPVEPLPRNAGWNRFLIPVLAVLAVLGLLWNRVAAPFVRERFVNLDIAYSTKRSAVDERAYYLMWEPRTASWRALLASAHGKDPREGLCRETYPLVQTAQRAGVKGLCSENWMMKGTLVWKCSESDLFLTDVYALPDPLLSHLNVDTSHPWRIGHAERAIPDGYRESVSKGANCIVDPDLREYYGKLLVVMTGRLLAADRLKTILDLNLGRFDQLLSRYESRKETRRKSALSPNRFIDEALDEIQSGGEAERAFASLDNALKLDDSLEMQAIVHYYRGLAFEDLNDDVPSAIAEYERALSGEWNEELSLCADRLARLAAIRGDLEEAISLWERSVRINSSRQEVLRNLSAAYRELDEKTTDIRKQ